MKITSILILATLFVVAFSVSNKNSTKILSSSSSSSSSSKIVLSGGFSGSALALGLKAALKFFTIFAPGHQAECKNPALDRCTAADRKAQFCTREIYEGCICYNNGTCTNAWVNKCSNCQNPDVFSVNKGNCSVVLGNTTPSTPTIPTTPIQTKKFVPYICPDLDPAVTMCAAYIRDACVCFKNGTCTNIQANACSTCFNSDVVSVNEGEECPAKKLQGSYARCFEDDGIMKMCTMHIAEGCTCYNNGTCVDTWVNSCSDCQRDDVQLVIEGGKCPANGVAPRSNSGAEEPAVSALNVCPDYDYSQIMCTQYIRDACVCYSNGTCSDTQANACSTCASNKVVSVNEGEKCPAKKLDGTYTRCRKDDGVMKMCTLQLTQGCTCYDDGHCESGWVNSCSDCQKKGVALVVEGGSCPAGGITDRS